MNNQNYFHTNAQILWVAEIRTFSKHHLIYNSSRDCTTWQMQNLLICVLLFINELFLLTRLFFGLEFCCSAYVSSLWPLSIILTCLLIKSTSEVQSHSTSTLIFYFIFIRNEFIIFRLGAMDCSIFLTFSLYSFWSVNTVYDHCVHASEVLHMSCIRFIYSFDETMVHIQI